MANVASDVAGVVVSPLSWDVALGEALDLSELWRRSASNGDPVARHALAVLHAPLVAYLMPDGLIAPGEDPEPAWLWSWRLVVAVEGHRPGTGHFLPLAVRAVVGDASEPRGGSRPSPGTCGRSHGPPDPVDRLVRDLTGIASGEPASALARRRGIDPMRVHALAYLAHLYEDDLPRRGGPAAPESASREGLGPRPRRASLRPRGREDHVAARPDRGRAGEGLRHLGALDREAAPRESGASTTGETEGS